MPVVEQTASKSDLAKIDLAKIRTDVVGSLLRPAPLKEARARFDDGAIDAAELRDQRRPRPLIERTAAFAGSTGIQSGDGAGDQRVVVSHLNSTMQALPAVPASPLILTFASRTGEYLCEC